MNSASPQKLILLGLTTLAVTASVAVLLAGPAVACGCFSPPVPPPDGLADFAVNQQSEQIIFEVPGDGTITAHVLIKYEGAPEQFAWLVPVPSVPVLALSETLAFAIIDQETAPQIRRDDRDICPDPEFICRYHPQPNCNDDDVTVQDAQSSGDSASQDTVGGGPLPGGVQVIQSQIVGDYETVVFSADDAMGTVSWLQDNGFIVNDTMTPFMQPYLDAGMLFIAAKLVPGAEVSAIRPLKMTYIHPRPIIPLKLTAVAAEPHLTVTSYIFADKAYRPMGHPMATIEPGRLTYVGSRSNYPMVLARTIDEAGGDAFVAEFGGAPPVWLRASDDACNPGGDASFPQIENDGICQCPRSDFDALDCAEDQPGLLEALALLDDLNKRFPKLTRLTTRLSAEEMTFDAEFEPTTNTMPTGPLRLDAAVFDLGGCVANIVDTATHTAIVSEIPCATLYCGAGSCVTTALGAGCRCDAGQVARTFRDLDGLPSVTCQPRQALVDLGADIELPDSCKGVTVADGTCVDVGGFPSSECAGTAAGVLRDGLAPPTCVEIQQQTGSPGAENFSQKLNGLDVCSPRPRACGNLGWLVANPNPNIVGISCPKNQPSQDAFLEPTAPQCPGTGEDVSVTDSGSDTGADSNRADADDGAADGRGTVRVGGGCQGADLDASWLLALSLLGLAVLRQRRRGDLL